MRTMALSLAALLLTASAGTGAEHEVRMLNRGPDGQPMQFDPAFIRIEPGDTVRFVATDRGHNSESILEMIPEGAEHWKGGINEEIEITFEIEGVYGYKCQPHIGMGMVGLIQVGDNLDNLDSSQTVRLPGRGKMRMEELIAQLSAENEGDAD